MPKILVTGAAGKLGSLVIDALLANGTPATDIIAGSRDPARLGDFAGRGIETRKVDFDDETGLQAAFAGVDRLLVISTDSIGEPGRRLTQHRTAIAAAKTAGIGRIFYTSMPKPKDSQVIFAPDHLGTEQAIEDSGLAYTIFRNGWYMENLLMTLPQVLKDGVWYTASADGRNGYVSRADQALAIAGGLAHPPAESVIYTLTGARALSVDDVAAAAAKVVGKPVKVVQLDDTQLAGGMQQAGVPEAIIPMLMSFEQNTRAGGFDIITGDVESLSGKPPTDIESFLSDNRSALA
ncbi:SDR family oxidoreductase [Rhizobium halophytocola]|uniref:NAD(P)H dehydrogenase (Quinone) n=1 Tax=Rhizobium halophytocola TaxID=735519 RepID=A0ABS4E6B2_9HYPH|nr:SDR family oxidoreductase [Rhizobium halophytocola]MBP1853479.1 NAD(P)H dehydrogenase (quinone) [Rhizobium halophytocola]